MAADKCGSARYLAGGPGQHPERHGHFCRFGRPRRAPAAGKGQRRLVARDQQSSPGPSAHGMKPSALVGFDRVGCEAYGLRVFRDWGTAAETEGPLLADGLSVVSVRRWWWFKPMVRGLSGPARVLGASPSFE